LLRGLCVEPSRKISEVIFHAEDGEDERRDLEFDMSMEGYAYNTLTDQVIGASIEIHKKLGPGLLESAYRECLARELLIRNIPFEREVAVPVVYKGVHLECGYRLDFLIAERLVVEVKSVEALAKVHEAQLITYLSLGGWQVGLLINFNEFLLKDGIRRKVFNYSE